MTPLTHGLRPLLETVPGRRGSQMAVAFRQFVRRSMSVLLPPSLFVVSGARGSASVYLTFDDGPHPVHTPRLLDVLRQQGVRATFFLVGQLVEQNPELVRRMIAEGHAIGHHTYTHSDPARTSCRQVLDELAATDVLLEKLVGFRPHLFRPPHGKLTPAKLLGLWLAGKTIVLWNADPKDFACPSSADVHRWFGDHPLQSGDIVLMHDSHPHAAVVLPELVRMVRQQGLDFGTLADRN